MPRKKRDGAYETGNIEQFRQELGLTPEDISDTEVLKIMTGDLAEQKRLSDNEKRRALEEKRQLDEEKRRLLAEKSRFENELSSAKMQKQLLESELNYEKQRKPFAVIEPLRSNSSMADYWTREKMKQDIKDELLLEKKKEAEKRLISKATKAFSKSLRKRSKSRKTKRSKSKRK